MPRAAGQIDVAKTEAILAAAGQVFSERGLTAPIDEVARRAGVSKQTIYNRYRSKADLVRELVTRKVEAATAPLFEPGALEHPEETLTAYGRMILDNYTGGNSVSMLRVTIEAAKDMPDVARAVYEAGPQASRKALAGYISAEAAAGRIEVDDPLRAASFFSGMLVTSRQIDGLLGIDSSISPREADDLAREVARRFLKLYAPA
ncbi:MAG: TetR/AcrR family transcriptional regulator [Caulobacteraceae bacterium]